MSTGAELHDLQILEQLRNALTKYQEGTTGSIISFEAELHKAIDWLDRRVNAWRREYNKCQEKFLPVKQVN